VKKQLICDTNIFYNYNSFWAKDKYSLLPTYYNFQDLLVSKSNIKNIEGRLQKTLKQKLSSMNNHEILLFEPHYYVIEDFYPNLRYSKILYNRLDTSKEYNYLNVLSQIIMLGESVDQVIKYNLVELAKHEQKNKLINVDDILSFAKSTFTKIGYTSKDQVNYLDFIPYVEKLLIKNIVKFGSKCLIAPSPVDKGKIDLSDYQLFIQTYSKYLSTLVDKNGENPALNDNIDSLILLYAKNGRKFMSIEKKWLRLIKSVKLHKQFLILYSTTGIEHFFFNYVFLKVFGLITIRDKNLKKWYNPLGYQFL